MKTTRLGDRLKSDATADLPSFDARLHRRVMEAVERSTDVEQSVDHPLSFASYRLQRFIPLALAALVLIAVGVWWGGVAQKHTEVVVAPTLVLSIPTELFTLRAGQLSDQINQSMSTEPLAALDQDTRRFTRFLAGQLDVFPLDREKAQ